MNAADILRAEACLFASFRAPEVIDIAGWQVRAASNGYRRLNSAWTARFDSRTSVGAAIAATEAVYAERNLPPRFMVLETGKPERLDAELAARGYSIATPTLTMSAPVRGGAMPADVVTSPDPTGDWLALFRSCQSLLRQTEFTATVEKMPRDRLFVTGLSDGAPAAIALGVFVEGAVAVEAVFTRAEARGQGLAGKALAAIDAWAATVSAERLYLAVVEDNAPARGLYAKAGYDAASRYHYRDRA